MSNIIQEIDDEGNTYYTTKYCMYSCDEDLDEIAFEGKCIIDEKPDGYFSKKCYTSPILTNPTYRDIFALCDDVVEITGDYHHIFMEGISIGRKMKNNVYKISLCLGS